MSTIKVDNIRIASESVSRPVRGVAAAWGQFNGISKTVVSDSCNFSSLEDGGVGIYTFKFFTEMTNDSYAATGSTGNSNVCGFIRVGSTSSSNIFINCRDASSGTLYNDQKMYVVAHGDLE